MIPLQEKESNGQLADDLDIWSKRYRDQGYLWGDTSSACAQALLSKLKPHARVLEFACGYGRDTKVLINKGHFVDAFDKSDVGVALARERVKNHINAHRAKIVHGDFLEARIQSGFFDAAISHRTLHLIDPLRASDVVEKIAASLKPEGTFILSARSPKDFNEQQMTWVKTTGANDNTTAIYKDREAHIIYFYDEARLMALLEDSFTNISFFNGEEIESCTNIDANGQHIMSQFIMVIAQKKA